ncbi:MAG: tRNA (adenosine(37)-N6)-threonylcarbamoyltransferase complex dimerization subunit type 1 TsaB [Ignavibacteriaceae bacterium]
MNETKPILAIETSQSMCSVCVYFSDENFFEMNVNLKNSHAEKLFETIDFVLKSSGIQAKDLDSIAVSAGPGSFTGLRIGMSAAKGLAFGAKLPIVPVPTFEAMALQFSSYLNDESEFIIANKVNVEEVYFAKFQIKANSYIFVENLAILTRDEFEKRKKNNLVFGSAVPVKIEGKIKNISAPYSSFVAKWCNLFGEKFKIFDYDFLEPNYLKNFIVKERKND